MDSILICQREIAFYPVLKEVRVGNSGLEKCRFSCWASYTQTLLAQWAKVQAKHPLTKSLTKMNEEWPTPKCEGCLPKGKASIQVFLTLVIATRYCLFVVLVNFLEAESLVGD